MTISDESSTANLFANLDAKLCYSLIAEETNHRCSNYCPEIRHRLWMKEAINGYIARNNGTKQDSEHDCHTCKIFHPTVAIGKPFTGFFSCKSKSNP